MEHYEPYKTDNPIWIQRPRYGLALTNLEVRLMFQNIVRMWFQESGRDYEVTSNRESGFGRYDVMLVPRVGSGRDAVIMEFKVHDAEDEKNLSETVRAALAQIEERQYAVALAARGLSEKQIRFL